MDSIYQITNWLGPVLAVGFAAWWFMNKLSGKKVGAVQARFVWWDQATRRRRVVVRRRGTPDHPRVAIVGRRGHELTAKQAREVADLLEEGARRVREAR